MYSKEQITFLIILKNASRSKIETVYAAIAFGKKHGIPVLLNPAPAAENLSFEKVCDCEFFMPNETELAITTGMPTETLDGVRAAAKKLLGHGLKNVIVTMGSRGSLWMSKDHEVHIEASEVKAVDTTGAGDAFIGCFAASYVASGDIEKSLRRASRYATLSVTRTGTQGSYADAEEFTAFLQELDGKTA